MGLVWSGWNIIVNRR